MKRSVVSLLIAILFLSLAVTGVMGFFLPFDLLTVAVHSILGFIFIVAVGWHVKNNARQLRKYFGSWSALWVILSVVTLIVVILYQPRPVKALLGLSQNIGPAVDQFELEEGKMVYHYNPSPTYRMKLDFKGGPAFDQENPPFIAIWIENTSRYHLKTLYHTEHPDVKNQLPYWSFKKSEYEKYKAESEALEKSEEQADADTVSSATPNASFDPADYIVPKDAKKETPYRLLIELNLPKDGNEHFDDHKYPGHLFLEIFLIQQNV